MKNCFPKLNNDKNEAIRKIQEKKEVSSMTEMKDTGLLRKQDKWQ